MKSVIVDELDLKGFDWDKPRREIRIVWEVAGVFAEDQAGRPVTRGPLEVRGTEEERARK